MTFSTEGGPLKHLCVNFIWWNFLWKEGLGHCCMMRTSDFYLYFLVYIPGLIFPACRDIQTNVGKSNPQFWPTFILWRRAVLSLVVLNLNGRCLHRCCAARRPVNSLRSHCFSHSLYDLWSCFIQSFPLCPSLCLCMSPSDRLRRIFSIPGELHTQWEDDSGR